jgi:hypothetical protein
MAAAVAEPPAREPYHIKLYNVPQRVEGGIKIYGYSSPAVNLPDDVVLLFDQLDGMYANCTVEGDEGADPTIIHLKATQPLVEYKDGYMIEEEPEAESTDVA